MKKTWLSMVVLGLLVTALLIGNTGFFSPEVSAEAGDMSNIVSVNGTGTITVKPDLAYINVGVETEDVDAEKAQADNAEKMASVMAALDAVGIEADDIKTTQYSVYDRYDYVDGEQKNKRYIVTNIVQVTIRDIDATGAVIDTAAKAGSNQISSIQFGISNEDEVYQEALKLAMTSAKNKAEAILSTFGKTSDTPSKVSETSYYSGVVRMDYGMAMSEKAMMDTPVSSGEMSITATVAVEYNY